MIIDKIEEIKDTLEDALLSENIYSNLGKTERILSIAGGTYIFLKGMRNVWSRPLIATTELIVGFGLLHRGITGYSALTEKFESEELGPEPILIVE